MCENVFLMLTRLPVCFWRRFARFMAKFMAIHGLFEFFTDWGNVVLKLTLYLNELENFSAIVD